MNIDSVIYWSHFKDYEDCPQKFLWSKGWDGIDCGGGEGRPKPNPNTDPKHHSIMGTAIQYAIEKMYNGELYRDPKNLVEVMKATARDEFLRQESKPRNHINWNKSDITRSEALQIVEDGVLGYLRTMKAHKLVGTYAKAEVDILGWINKYTPIGGRADLIIRREDTGTTILDGKNTKHKMLYTDPDQLRWYALLFRLSYKKNPDRLGFLWYRFPHGSLTHDENGNEHFETGVEWISFDDGDLRGLAHRVIEMKNKLRKGDFSPNPVPSKCKLCDFESVCESRQAQRAANASKYKKKEKESEPAEVYEMQQIEVKGGIKTFTI
jgi:hypothetical protein